MTTATPRPWRVVRPRIPVKDNDFGIRAPDNGLIAEVFEHGGNQYTEISPAEANAALIVRAVNSHDALVAALEAVYMDICNGNMSRIKCRREHEKAVLAALLLARKAGVA